MAVDIAQLLTFSVKNNASDLHLSAGVPPMIRVDGDVKRINMPELSHKEVHSMIYDIMNDKQRKDFEEFLETDFSFEIPKLARFRVNAFNQARGAGAVFRTIPSEILTLEDLMAPAIFKDISMYPRGIVLVTGPTGSGKSTTLAAMIDYINDNKPDHILTIEDPIEFVHQTKSCLISQREVGLHSDSFADALRSALREDPDVILVGEMRDLETISIAVTAAEMGILVMGTLHTNGAAQTVDRIINSFPHDKQAHIRTMISTSLRGVVSQQLLPTKGKPGRVAALEVLINTPAVANLIRQGKLDQLETAMQSGGGIGMQTMDSALMELVETARISGKEAYQQANNKSKFERFKNEH
ncbi:MAG: type IV pilus twitching motility protein PilT [Woeseiaceae bacterium]